MILIFFKPTNTLTNVEINNSMCILIFHLYVLLNNSTEEQLLIRLFNLIPQIVSSYESEEQINEAHTTGLFSTFHSQAKQTAKEKQPVNSSTTSLRDSTHNHPLLSSSSSNRSSEDDANTPTSEGDNGLTAGDFDLDTDDYEFNLSEAALFFAQFLLKIYENVFVHVDKVSQFSSSYYLEGVHLTTSCASAFLKDYQTNAARDLNYVQQLLMNKLMFLLYIVNSGTFNKISNAVCLLVNDKIKNRPFAKGNLFILM
jgi:hypothetical protein